MMDSLQLEGDLPALRKPMLIAAFRGWNDAGEAATLAVRHLVDSWSAQAFASIDAEEFFDFTVARPMIHISEEGQRDLQWPPNRFYYAALSLFQRLEGSRLMTLGALVAATTHRRPPPVTGFSTEEELRGRLEGMTISGARYQRPTGILRTPH